MPAPAAAAGEEGKVAGEFLGGTCSASHENRVAAIQALLQGEKRIITRALAYITSFKPMERGVVELD